MLVSVSDLLLLDLMTLLCLVGIEGWVEIVEENDWKHLAVGNERLFKDPSAITPVQPNTPGKIVHCPTFQLPRMANCCYSVTSL
jgi:hypothetical protein